MTFAPIGLDELVAVAALQTRIDRKYVVPRSALPAVLADLDPGTRALEMDGQRTFAYESVYFDTPELASYLGAARRRRHRFKVRTRAYLDTGSCYLEVKTPGSHNATVKERIEHDLARQHSLGCDGAEYTRETLRAARVDAEVDQLVPVLQTRYRRATLFVPRSNSRATIDLDLSWHLETGPAPGPGALSSRGTAPAPATASATGSLELGHLAIVETKSGSSPSDVDRALWRHGIRPAVLSKYGTGMAALVPGLPSTKWARVLRTHFTPPTTTTQQRAA